MTKEQIKEAALQCAKDRWGDSESQHVMAKAQGTVYGFKQGVQWRINSVWHKNSVRPGEDCDVLVETKYGIELDRYDIDYNELDNGTDWETEVIRWAYIDDLLPERKED